MTQDVHDDPVLASADPTGPGGVQAVAVIPAGLFAGLPAEVPAELPRPAGPPPLPVAAAVAGLPGVPPPPGLPFAGRWDPAVPPPPQGAPPKGPRAPWATWGVPLLAGWVVAAGGGGGVLLGRGRPR